MQLDHYFPFRIFRCCRRQNLFKFPQAEYEVCIRVVSEQPFGLITKGARNILASGQLTQEVSCLNQAACALIRQSQGNAPSFDMACPTKVTGPKFEPPGLLVTMDSAISL